MLVVLAAPAFAADQIGVPHVAVVLQSSARSSRFLRRQVARIFERFDVSRPAVPVDRIALGLGADVRFAAYDGEVAGMLARSEGTSPVTGVNSRHLRARQCFTIAHELGYLVLHDVEMHIDRDFRVMHRNHISSLAADPLEIEANRLAAELLTPYDIVVTDLEERGIDM